MSRPATHAVPSDITSDAASAAARNVAAETAAATSESGSTSENFRKLPTFEEARKSEAAPDDGEPLPPRQAAAVAALIAGKTLAAVAKEMGISARTLYTWRREPRFAIELTRRTAETLDAGSMRACDLMLLSTDLLAQTLRGQDRFRWAFRVATSKRIWEMAQHLPRRLDFDASTKPD